ncbi:MAG TPA: hypothetical protein VFR36_05565 [Sphingomicrobium sp.]|nr:hypothetical protein [Sphingomicrobium sp.]
MTWAKIIAGLLSLLRTVARWIEEGRIRADERNRIELEARRARDARIAAADAAVDRLQHDPESVAADPRNRRRRKGDRLSDYPTEDR